MSLLRRLGNGRPFFLVAGLNVIENAAETFECAAHIKDVCQRLELEFVFKASCDKANRSNHGAFRGVGMEAGVKILSDVRTKLGIPVVTDVHEPSHCELAMDLDMLQIPAFLCRQTDLIQAAARTGLPLLLKKGQFASAGVMHAAREKALAVPNASGVILCERGSSLGENQLFLDVRNLVRLRHPDSLVMLDCTHSGQIPAARVESGGGSSGEFFAVQAAARAGAAVGVDGLFLEVHPNPARAPVDSSVQMNLDLLEPSVKELMDIARASQWRGEALQ